MGRPRPHDPGAAVGRAVARHRGVDGRPPREDGRGPPEQGQLRSGHDAAGALGGLRELTERSRLLSYKYLDRLTSYARATMVLRPCYLRAPVHKKNTHTLHKKKK